MTIGIKVDNDGVLYESALPREGTYCGGCAGFDPYGPGTACQLPDIPCSPGGGVSDTELTSNVIWVKVSA